jgi:hypothetical protein
MSFYYIIFLMKNIIKKVSNNTNILVNNTRNIQVNTDTYKTFINNNIFKYKSKYRRIHKQNKNYVGLVNDHHVIPKSLKNHNLLKQTNFCVNQNYNLYIMPNSFAAARYLNLRNDVMIHQGCHNKYNLYVKKELNKINELTTLDEKNYYLWLFLHFLKKNLKYNEDIIPWN